MPNVQKTGERKHVLRSVNLNRKKNDKKYTTTKTHNTKNKKRPKFIKKLAPPERGMKIQQ